MADVAACLRDGYSTGGTSGNGLGAVKRLAHQMLFHSVPGSGHRRAGADGRGGRTPVAHVAIPPRCACRRSGETVCGDTAAIVSRPDGTCRRAAGRRPGPRSAGRRRLRRGRAAVPQTCRRQPDGDPGRPACRPARHARRRRGDRRRSIRPRRQVTYGGIGNIAGFIIDTGGVRRMVSHSGTAGHTAGRLQDFRYPLHNRPVLVMYSDGLATSWSPESHPGLFALDPLLIAGVLYRDHARGRDDASVVVWKG